MPAAPLHRQAAISSWFDKQGAQVVRRIEQDYLQQQLASMPTLPWLWMGPAADWKPQWTSVARGICLHRTAQAGRFSGDLACTLPLPLPAEAVNAIVLQHVDVASADALLDECARVLMPGGRLWISLFNPCSPYRLHWQWHGAGSPTARHCRGVLQQLGLQCAPLRYLGPLWRMDKDAGVLPAPPVLRAVAVLEAHKRTLAGLGPRAKPLRLPRPLLT